MDILKKNDKLKRVSEIKIDDEIYVKSKRLHPKKYTTMFGQLSLKRYAYKPKTRDKKYDGSKNIYPLDVSANLPKNSYSYVMQEMVVLASNNQSYKQASKFIDKIFNITLCVDTIERITKDTSIAFNDFFNNLKPQPAKNEEIVVLSTDGKGVPMTKEESKKIKGRPGKGEKKQKKKESLVSVCYATTPISRTATQVSSSLILGSVDKDMEQFKTKDILKFASITKTKKECYADLKNYSKKISNGKKLVILLDGAKSLWSLTESTFHDTDYVGILDIIHVRDYLYSSAHSLYGEGGKDVSKWVFKRCKMILDGDVKSVISELENISINLSPTKQKIVQKTITYFANHLQQMKYDEYLKEGYPIASGVVESACSQVVANRCELPGARWSMDGAESILKHRSIFASDLWDEYWLYDKVFKRNKNYSSCIDAVNNVLDQFRLCG